MDLIFYLLIALWVLLEMLMFLLKTRSAKTEYDINTQFLNESDFDGAESHNSSDLSIFDYDYEVYEDDSGVVGTAKPTKKIDKKRRQLLLAKRLARRNQDRQIVLAYFQNKKSDTKSESEEAEDGYDSDDETSQAELIELYVRMAEFIRWHRIVSLYDLSYKFQLTTKTTHEFLEKLQIIGLLQGVCDDRGKFIYVAETELTAVSKFIEEQDLYDWPQIGLI